MNITTLTRNFTIIKNFIFKDRLLYTHSAISIVEVVVSTVIFMIVAIGTFSVFSMTRQMSVASDKEIQAAHFGRQLLEELRSQVDVRTWDDFGGLTCDNNTHDWPDGTTFEGNPIQYQCDESLSDGDLRKLTITLSWDD